VGYKVVRLFAPADSKLLYRIAPGGGGGSGGGRSSSGGGAKSAGGGDAETTTAQGNISAVDAESPDAAAHPLALDATPHDALLGPGDVLFIPKGWWHAVRALTPSFSLNFWF
jgi:hypothetical protein